MANDMSGTVDALKDFLNSPDAGEKIETLMGAFLGGEDSESASIKPKEHDSASAAPDIPMDSILKIVQAYSHISKQDDKRVNLLKAVKPYVRKSRADSVDTAIKLLGLMRLAPLLGDLKDVL